ncbi:LysE family translocator [Aliiglaciecola sp. CAU 1673]|uniref:LysE family translocator n=1 Tax=Aliiglaciecola sp. CAU 1673 TaxID=3032595 RepID=UPI0031F399BA
MGIENLWLFVLAGIMLNILPGPDSLYVATRAGTQGFKAGSMAALGIGAGTMVHVSAAALGLSAILATSAMAFTLIKWVGCLYLLYIGISMLLARTKPSASGALHLSQESMGKIFSQGFLTNVLNPKVALFFLAFVPQYISAEAPSKMSAFLLLGLIFNLNGMIWCHLLAWGASSAGQRLRGNSALNVWLSKAVGGLFCYFGIKLALSEK